MLSFKNFLVEFKLTQKLELNMTSYDELMNIIENDEKLFTEFKKLKIKDFKRSFNYLKGAIKYATTKRAEMPVIESKDYNKFQAWMVKKHGIKSSIKHVEVKKLKPTQKQIYLVKFTDNLRKRGAEAFKAFLNNTKLNLITSKDNYIIDGHHRWQSSILYKPTMKTSVIEFDTDYKTLLRFALEYSDNVAGNVRNESKLVKE